MLAGPAGTGKTRLLREALHRARRAGRDVAQVAATRSAAAIPFGAVSGLLSPGGPAAGAPWELLRRAADQLARPTSQPPLVVGADDVHLLDRESAALLHHLVLHGAVFLVTVVRAGEPAPDAVAALWKDGLAGGDRASAARRGHGRPARPDARPGRAGRRPAAHPLGDRRQPAAAPRTAGRRAGRGRAGPAGDRLGLEGPAVLRRPRVVEVVDGWLAALGDGSRTALEVVACAEPLPAELLNELADRGALDPAAVETAERRGVISCGYSGSRQVLRPGHPIYGEMIRATLPRGKAQRIAGGWPGRGGVAGTGTDRGPAPAHRRPTVDGLPLTRREHEIAVLATSGLTSKAIATSLHLSVRTVNNHLARTYAKAGISCRAELAAIMTRTALAGSPSRVAGLPAEAPPSAARCG